MSPIIPNENLDKFKRTESGKGPHGLGDPDDLSLRKVEQQVLIPKIMRERAKTEKCVAEVKAFTECCSNSSLAMVFSCRKENTALRSCMERWYADEEFKQQCTKIFLDERSEFRRTGLEKKYRTQKM
ncbi:COX assembly mitochondrial protein homolog [Neocloeon triangulifer]|uniref:COX assembly mitochondrial protein homolog n=1 Tax=Neocloeon triangulifer TaxID=2078957 RepID=UPI00286F0C4F|nr:COX assembly mitochondrial protein homolog [Neocloeon triangulifer]